MTLFPFRLPHKLGIYPLLIVDVDELDLSATMAPSASLQIPSGDSSAGPSRHGNPNASRPVSVNVHSQSTPSPAATSKRQRASHTVVSSSHDHSTNGHRQNGRERNQDNQTPYTDVYSHPAAVAYANAHPKRTIPKFGPYLLLQTLGEGEFGKVKLGLHSQWGEEVAVKLIRRGNIDTAIRMSKVEREIEVLKVNLCFLAPFTAPDIAFDRR